MDIQHNVLMKKLSNTINKDSTLKKIEDGKLKKKTKKNNSKISIQRKQLKMLTTSTHQINMIILKNPTNIPIDVYIGFRLGLGLNFEELGSIV